MQKMKETRVWSLGWEDPLEKEMATHSNIPTWEIPWTEEPGGLQSMALQRVGQDLATEHAHLYVLRATWLCAIWQMLCSPQLLPPELTVILHVPLTLAVKSCHITEFQEMKYTCKWSVKRNCILSTVLSFFHTLAKKRKLSSPRGRWKHT